MLDKYSKQVYSLPADKADEVYNQIISQLDLNDDDDREFFEDVYKAAIKYAGIRAEWNLMSREEKVKKDASRTTAHNSFITNLNMLAQYMSKTGRDSSWREELGDLDKDPSYRKKIGDFACWMVLFSELEVR